MIKKILKSLILPLILVLQWDAVPPPGAPVVVTGMRLKVSNTPGGPYSTYIQTTDPSGTTSTDWTLTSGSTRCYVAVTYGTISGVPTESAPSNEICKTNTTDAPLVGPGPGKGNIPAYR